MKVAYKIDLFFSGIYIIIALSSGVFLSIVLRSPLPFVLSLIFSLLYAWISTKRARKRLRAVRRPFPDSWRRILRESSYFYFKLDPEAKRRFERDLKIFLSDFSITGRKGHNPSMEAKLLAAAGVVTLLQGHPNWEPPTKDGIVIYPGARFSEDYMPGKGNITGMAPYRGPMLLSEEEVLRDFTIPPPPFNVVYHETAHFFDWEDGRAEGLPLARMPADLQEQWMGVMEEEMERLRRGESILRDYAGRNYGELFAVVTEVFFTTPLSLKKYHFRLYELLRRFYNLDPATIYFKKGS